MPSQTDCLRFHGSDRTRPITWSPALIMLAFSMGQVLAAGPTPTTTSLNSSANPSVFGAPVTLTATVNASPVPTGKVTFYDGANILGIGSLNGAGTASLNTIMIQAGHRNLRATYAGDASYAPSTSAALPQTVNTVAGNSFTFKSAIPVHSAYGDIAVGDFDRDGKLDIAHANNVAGDVSVLIGDGAGNFAASVNYPLSGSPGLIATGDFDGDGNLDLFCMVSLPPSGHTGQILFGNGDGTFKPAVDVPNLTTTAFTRVAIGDFDGNGTADIAVQTGTGNVLILLGNGDGTFVNGSTVLTGGGSLDAALAIGDFRGIGRADLATGGSPANMFLNNGGGTATFTKVIAPSMADPANNTALSTYIADLHGSGHEDVITGSGTYDVHVIPSNGDGTFQVPVLYGPGLVAAGSFAAGDFNGDGSLDFISNGATPAGGPVNAATVFYNNGNGTFKSSVPIYGGCSGTSAVRVGDFNGDGIADFVTADQFSGVCLWLGSANPGVAPTTATSVDVTIPYQSPGVPFQMSATVSSPSGTVNSGTVNIVIPYFTGIATEIEASAPVSVGVATVLFPGESFGPAVGVYNAYVTFLGTGALAASGAQPVHLIVTGIPTTTTASPASVNFSVSSQTVTLNATVTSTATVDSGTVTFNVAGIGSVSSAVTNGAASTTLLIPPGQAAGTYPINASYNAVSPLANSSDNSQVLTISTVKANTTTTASAASALFSASAQTVALNAIVTSPSGVVNSGTVTFTVTGVGSATSGTVATGAASAILTIPPGQAAASYTIQAVYSGTANLNTSSDSSKSLVISAPAGTTIAAAAAAATFNTSSQTVTLSASVTSTSGAVSGGTVAFTVTGIGTVTSGTVASGATLATLTIPAGQAVATYAINAVYSGSGTLAGSSDSSHSLTISKANTVTTASAASASFSPSSQTITLNATVTSPSGVLNSGTVTFTVTGVGSATSGTVATGAASAVLTIPAGQAVASYTIQTVYSGTANLNTSTDSSKSLVISSPTIPTTISTAAVSTKFSPSAQTITLQATVASTAGRVNAGSVTFTISGVGAATGNVTRGHVMATLTIPGGTTVGTYPFTAVYNPAAGFSTSSGSNSLTVVKATPVISWVTPASVVAGTMLGSAQLNATASTLGVFVYTPPAGTKVVTGTQALSVTFTPSDAVDYKTASASVKIVGTPPQSQFYLQGQFGNAAPPLTGPLAGGSFSGTWSVDSGSLPLKGLVLLRNWDITLWDAKKNALSHLTNGPSQCCAFLLSAGNMAVLSIADAGGAGFLQVEFPLPFSGAGNVIPWQPSFVLGSQGGVTAFYDFGNNSPVISGSSSAIP